MGRFSKAISSPKVNIALFVVAALLLLVSVVGGTRAALTYFSDSYVARLQVSSIGVTLLENGNEVAYRNYDGDDKWSETPGTDHVGDLLQNMVPANEKFKIGKNYDEAISVKNTGNIGQYVRVTIRKYWEDANGKKVRVLSPKWIELKSASNSDWIIDKSSSTEERTVYYYTKPLSEGETSSALSSALKVDSEIMKKVTETPVTDETTTDDGHKVITTTYDYNGYSFCLEAEVDAVQEHNAKSAIKSAWGKNVTISKSGKLGLV